MASVRCPSCGQSDQVELTSPDYGMGAAFRCYNCNKPYGIAFSSSSPEALDASSAARAASAQNAARYSEQYGDPTRPWDDGDE